MSLLKIAGAALNQTPIDWDNNTRNIILAIEQAKNKKVNILCLPELCLTGYGCEDLFLSDWVPDKALEHLLRLKDHCENISVSIGIPVKFKGILYNTGCLISNKEILGFTAKQFLANDGVHYEKRWFNAWEAGRKEQIKIEDRNYDFGDITYNVNGIKIGYEICEDAWRSDDVRPACRHLQNKVHLILNPSASHFAFGKSKLRNDLVTASSQKFNCTYLYANLLGNEAGRIIYDGEVLISKNGKLLQRNKRLSFQNVNLITAEVNFKTGETTRETVINDTSEKEAEFRDAASLGLFDYLRKSKNKGFILSLSGGADSSACAVLISEMVKGALRELGINEFILKSGLKVSLTDLENLSFDEQVKKIMTSLLFCAYQGTKNSGEDTFNSAKELAISIGANFYSWKIDEEVESYTSTIEKQIGRKLEWKTDDITLQNIQARSRSPIIWMLANIFNSLLITTSNRSEGDVGYATMDGDTSGSIAPIAGVDKHFIQKWLVWAEKELGQYGLEYVNRLTPTAELRPKENSQTDETDLMPYKIMVEIERVAIRDHKSPIEVFNSLKILNLENEDLLKAHIKKFFRLWSRNQWKRERLAPSFHFDDFNVDPRSWCRFPILNGGFESELNEL